MTTRRHFRGAGRESAPLKVEPTGGAAWSVGGRGARLLAEAAWIAGHLIALALALALLSYRRAHPGFSHSVAVSQVGNLAGRVGAWVADALLVAFGFSAYVWVLAALAWSARTWRRLFVRATAAEAVHAHLADGGARRLRALSGL